MVDVPESIVQVVKEGGAHSTHFHMPEPAEKLAEKSLLRAEEWKPKAQELFKKMPLYNQRNFPKFLKYHQFKKKHTDGRRLK